MKKWLKFVCANQICLSVLITCAPPIKERIGCWVSPNSNRPKNTLAPSQEISGSILGFSNENSRWLSTPSPKAQHWNHSGSDTFITAHKADGWSQKGLWNLEDVWAGLGQTFHTELSYREETSFNTSQAIAALRETLRDKETMVPSFLARSI